MSRRLLLAPLAVALFAAGCGGSTPSDQPSAPTRTAPHTDGLRVDATDLRLGDASLGTHDGGLQELQVPRHRIDPDRLRRQGANRQGVGAGASCPDQDLLPDGSNTAAIIASTLCLLNGERADAGLPPLSTDDKLAAAAVEHSQDMVANQYFAHQALDGRDVVDRIRATGYIPEDSPWTVGENLAWGTGTLASPKNVVIAWMNSQGHRENILRGAFTQIGFGVAPGNPASTEGGGATYTTTFGSLGGESAPAAPQTVAATRPASTKPASRKSPARKRHHKVRARKARASTARMRARAARRHARMLHARAARAARA
jgi:uncharacterized protein YkwD